MDNGKVLLEQLEQILECDPLIDEIGFVHPTQLDALYDDQIGNLQHPSSPISQIEHAIFKDDVHLSQYDEKAFWHQNHKLAISTLVLSRLYSAAMVAYRDSDRKYKESIKSCLHIDSSENSLIPVCDVAMESLGNDILKHSKVLLILSCDFGSAWNSRKLVISRNCNHLLLVNELQLSQLILSYSPKSDYAWSHRQWVIRNVSGNFPNLEEIIGRESELVKIIAERTKMNYRAWNHRCCMVSYMTMLQVLEELRQSRNWARMHVADSSCFHYRRRLLCRLQEWNFVMEELYVLWKDELHWNQSLIEQYAGREALWMHRRFLLCWGLAQFAAANHHIPSHINSNASIHLDLPALIDQELQFLEPCFTISDDQFEDMHDQAASAASYLLWMWKISYLKDDTLKQKLKRLGGIHSIVNRFCPEKSFLLEVLKEEDA